MQDWRRKIRLLAHEDTIIQREKQVFSVFSDENLPFHKKYTYLCTHKSPDGGIGRRAGLKHQWGNPCRFDPGSGYFIKSFKISQDAENKQLARFLDGIPRLVLLHVCSTSAPHLQGFEQNEVLFLYKKSMKRGRIVDTLSANQNHFLVDLSFSHS